jgi:hypothetical protein
MRDLKTTFWAICVVVGFAFPAWNNHVFAATPVKTEKKIEKKKKEEKKVKKHKKFDGTKIPDDKKKK